jgi:deoxyribodipyrimidine photolyase-related protein
VAGRTSTPTTASRLRQAASTCPRPTPPAEDDIDREVRRDLDEWQRSGQVRLTEWFHANFVDGYDWVMVPNVVGMSQHADGGLMATKRYASGGAYINRMSDYCGDCAYRPTVRLGPQACPFTAGYWAFIDRHGTRFAANPRMTRQVKAAARLADLAQVAEQERQRGAGPP